MIWFEWNELFLSDVLNDLRGSPWRPRSSTTWAGRTSGSAPPQPSETFSECRCFLTWTLLGLVLYSSGTKIKIDSPLLPRSFLMSPWCVTMISKSLPTRYLLIRFIGAQSKKDFNEGDPERLFSFLPANPGSQPSPAPAHISHRGLQPLPHINGMWILFSANNGNNSYLSLGVVHVPWPNKYRAGMWSWCIPFVTHADC